MDSPGEQARKASRVYVCINQLASCCGVYLPCLCGSGSPMRLMRPVWGHTEELGPRPAEGCRKPSGHEMVRCIQGTPAGCWCGCGGRMMRAEVGESTQTGVRYAGRGAGGFVSQAAQSHCALAGPALVALGGSCSLVCSKSSRRVSHPQPG